MTEILGEKFVAQKFGDSLTTVSQKLQDMGRFLANEKHGKRRIEFLEKQALDNWVLDTKDDMLMQGIAKYLFEQEQKQAIDAGQSSDAEYARREIERTGGPLNRYRDIILQKVEAQKQSLVSWFEYMKSNDAEYPLWFLYYVTRSLQSMGNLDKKDKLYTARKADTMAVFPDFNAETLAFVYRAILQKNSKLEIKLTIEEELEISKLNVEEGRKKKREILQKKKQDSDNAFLSELGLDEKRKEVLEDEILKRVERADFGKLYAFAITETKGSTDRESVEGEWVKFAQGSDFKILENTLKNKNTGWCTAAGEAKRQLEQGDFYVYYTKGKNGSFTEPRIAIKTIDGRIDNGGEVRGINRDQGMEPQMIDIAKEFYQKLPGAEKYEKAGADMKKMTEIFAKCFKISKDENGKEIRTYLNPELSKEELRFLYEVDSKIETFGYDKDSRVEQVIGMRDFKKTMAVIFDWQTEELERKWLSFIHVENVSEKERLVRTKRGLLFDKLSAERQGRVSDVSILEKDLPLIFQIPLSDICIYGTSKKTDGYGYVQVKKPEKIPENVKILAVKVTERTLIVWKRDENSEKFE